MPRAMPGGPDVAGAAAPWRWIGAEAAGGLVLPSATPTASHLYGPRGVWLDEERLVVADTGNHRVLIWNDPDGIEDHRPADIVLGQPGFETEGAQAAGRGPANGMRLPTGVVIHNGALVVADAWNHRLLVWQDFPTKSDQPPDAIVGQPDSTSIDENRGGGCGPKGFYWPFGLAVIDDRLWVADTGNRRLVIFDGIPARDDAPLFVLGQSGPNERDENRGELGPASFRWPHDIAPVGNGVVVADAGNHRLLGWTAVPTGDCPAQEVFGQPDFVTAVEIPYHPQSAATLRFPYAVAVGPDLMAVADTANNRVLVWDDMAEPHSRPADRVLGQPDFGEIGENRWDAVGLDTFCWPYGLSFCGRRLAVADSGNNRVTIWDL